MTDPEIAEFVRERDEALLSLDLDVIKAYCRKWGAPEMKDDLVHWAGIHKARTAVTNFPADEKQKSKDWLAIHGFSHLDGSPQVIQRETPQ